MTSPLLLDFPEARTALGGIGRTTLYELVNSHQLTAAKIGRRSFITRASIEAYVDRLTATASDPDAA